MIPKNIVTEETTDSMPPAAPGTPGETSHPEPSKETVPKPKNPGKWMRHLGWINLFLSITLVAGLWVYHVQSMKAFAQKITTAQQNMLQNWQMQTSLWHNRWMEQSNQLQIARQEMATLTRGLRDLQQAYGNMQSQWKTNLDHTTALYTNAFALLLQLNRDQLEQISQTHVLAEQQKITTGKTLQLLENLLLKNTSHGN